MNSLVDRSGARGSMGTVSVFRAQLAGLALATVLAGVASEIGHAQNPNLPGAATQTAVMVQPEMGPVTPIMVREAERIPRAPDLVASLLSFTSSGRVTYRVENRGRSATGNPFVVDIHIDGQRKDTIKHNPLPPMSAQTVVSNLARADTCQTVALRLVLDSQRLVAEADEGNNILTRQQVPPCPDLTVNITKDSVNNNLEYRAKVTVTNSGNLSTQGEFVVVLTGSAAYLPTMPILVQKRMGPLAPGQSMHFYEDGKHYGTTTMNYHALVDRFGEIRESNKGNNEDRRTLGPH